MNIFRKLFEDAEDWFGEELGELELVLEGPAYSITPYIVWVDEGRLARSSRFKTIKDLAFAQHQFGLKGTVDLRAETVGEETADDYMAAQGDLLLRTWTIPVIDNTVPVLEQIVFFLDLFAEDVAPLVVHCEAGKGRTGIMAACYEQAILGVPAADTLARAKQFGMGFPCQLHFVGEGFPALLAAGKVVGQRKYPL